MAIKISVVIPVKNGKSTIQNCLEGITKQSIYDQTEIIVIDSGSNDGTLELLKKYPEVKLFEIPPKDFNHGATRNYGVSIAKGEFVVMTVQDAVAADEFWLERMITHFEDIRVAGVCGQQIVPHHPSNNPHQWFRPYSSPSSKKIIFEHPVDFQKLLPKEQMKYCRWDDVNAMYRKSCLEETPFEQVVYGEDKIWSKTALSKGYALVYDSASKVEHYHFNTPDYTYKRTLISLLFQYKSFGTAKIKSYSIFDYALIVYRNIKWKLPLKWIFHNFSLIWNIQKANKDFEEALKTNSIESLEKNIYSNVPQGKQQKKLSIQKK